MLDFVKICHPINLWVLHSLLIGIQTLTDLRGEENGAYANDTGSYTSNDHWTKEIGV